MTTTTEATAVREKPIIFGAEMVRAILDGCKSQTRRVVKPGNLFDGKEAIVKRFPRQSGCPYGEPGGLLWVREAWRLPRSWDETPGGNVFADVEIKYDADGFVHAGVGDGCWGRYRHARFMPRKASRLTLEITDVRVQRAHDISDTDAIAEGVGHGIDPSYQWIQGRAVNKFQSLWDCINGKSHPWASNPWVWAMTFKMVRP